MWGYVTNCGTEGNLHGILVGREVGGRCGAGAARECWVVFWSAGFGLLPSAARAPGATNGVRAPFLPPPTYPPTHPKTFPDHPTPSLTTTRPTAHPPTHPPPRRQALPDGVLYSSRESHYSVFKAARMYRMDAVKVDTLPTGEIDYDHFAALLAEEAAGRGRPAIVNVNIGTTVKGAVDDVDKVRAVVVGWWGGFWCFGGCGWVLAGFFEVSERLIDSPSYPPARPETAPRIPNHPPTSLRSSPRSPPRASTSRASSSTATARSSG
jgi:hypothetical protein